jgi:RNA polymerase sigma factor (sigma-70 family)
MERRARITSPRRRQVAATVGATVGARHEPSRERVNEQPEDVAALFARTRDAAARFAYLLTGSSAVADDIVGDAFAQVIRRWGELHEPKAYLYRAIVSGARSWGRTKGRTYALDRPAPVDVDTDAFVVRAVLARLPLQQREVLVLRYYVGLTDPEIAATLELPLGTAKSHLRRGPTAMKKELT